MKFHETSPAFLLRHPFWFYVKTHPRAIAVGLSTLVLTNVLDGLWPLVLKEGLDQIAAKAPLSDLGRTTLIFFLIMASMAVSRFAWRMGFGYFQTAIGENLRRRAFRRLSELTPRFFQSRPVGELMSLLVNDVQNFRQAMGSGLLVFLDGVIILAVILPIMISMNASWTLKSLAFLPAVPVLIWWVTKKIHMAAKSQQEVFARLTGHVQETVTGMRVLKGFALEDRRLRSFQHANADYERASNRLARIDAVFGPIMELGVTSGTVIFLFVARDDLLAGSATIGSFVAFHRYIMKTVWPMTALGMGLSQLQKGFGSFERVAGLLRENPELRPAGSRALVRFESLELRRVGVRYPGRETWALRGLDLALRPGQRLGLQGPVGSGKSTLLALLTRQMDPDEGEILLNGHPLHEYSLETVRGVFTLVPQDVFLFNESVSDNISFATEDADLERVRAAAHDVDIADEINSWPDSYEALLGERGVNLSGGQKQRLALARGILRNSPVLLLDDVLSAVDTRTERKIEAVLGNLRKAGSAQILVSHRETTLSTCDTVVRLSAPEEAR